MPRQALLQVLIFALFITLTFSSSPSPAPSPQSPYLSNSPSISPQSGDSDGPSSDSTFSPMQSLPPLSGTPDDDSYGDEPSPDVKSSPAPAPIKASDVAQEEEKSSEERKESSDKGMSGGKKVGVAFGLIAAACFVGFGGVVYRKRQDNIRRQQYIAAQRLEF